MRQIITVVIVAGLALGACGGGPVNPVAPTVVPVAPLSPGPAGLPFAVSLPIRPQDYVHNAFGVNPFGAHIGDHGIDGHPGWDIEYAIGAPVLPNFILPQGATSLTVTLTPPGSLRRERLRQLDLKLSKTFRSGGLSIGPTLDVYNLFNADKIFNYQSLNYANTAGTYLVPNAILLGRVVGMGALVRW
jgi:hypothetical protein